jgi:hypothetical protein
MTMMEKTSTGLRRPHDALLCRLSLLRYVYLIVSVSAVQEHLVPITRTRKPRSLTGARKGDRKF